MKSHVVAHHADLNSRGGTLRCREKQTRFALGGMTKWKGGVFLWAMAAIIGAEGFFAESAHAKRLKHKATGFSVAAPTGFRLRASNGIYSIKKGSDVVTVMKVDSPLAGSGVAESFITAARMKGARVKGGGAKTVVTGNIGKKSAYVEILGAGPTFTVKKYVTKVSRKKDKQARRLTPLTLRDIALLRRIGNSARGGIISPFQIDIPMQRFTQGVASALVPNIPGWNFSGVGGAIDGSLPGQGFFSLGIYFPSQASSSNPGQVILNDWPRFNGATILNIQIIPGTEGILGFPFNSAKYTIRLSIGGIVYDAIMTSGVTPNQNGFGIDWYHSVIAVRTATFPGLGDALSQTWATWDASVSQASRIASTIATIRSTPTIAIDRDAFDRIHSAWVDYIRM